MLTLDSKRMTSKVSQERETDVEYEKEEKKQEIAWEKRSFSRNTVN